MKVVDAHFHLWNLKENYYPWLSDEPMKKMILGDYSTIRRDYLISEFLNDASCIDLVAAVHIQAEHDEHDHVRETRWLQGVADLPESRGFPQAIIANADIQSDDFAGVLEAHCEAPNMRGLRQAVHRWLNDTPPYDPLLDPAWVKNFSLLEEYSLSFDLQVFPNQIEACVGLIRRYPRTSFVLTHLGLPLWPGEEAMDIWSKNIVRYSEFPNVYCKLSGFGMVDRKWTAASVRPLVDHIIEHFGTDRCMVASNYPVESLSKTYKQLWDEYSILFAPHSEDDKRALFADTAARVYRIAI